MMPKIANLRQVGGSVMLAVPPVMLEQLDLSAGSTVKMTIDRDSLIVKPAEKRPAYTLEELLAQCDPGAPLSDEDRQWLSDSPRGREIL